MIKTSQVGNFHTYYSLPKFFFYGKFISNAVYTLVLVTLGNYCDRYTGLCFFVYVQTALVAN